MNQVGVYTMGMAQPSVLLVEDNQTLRMVYRTQLERDGNRVFEAETAKAAQNHLALNHIDLMVLDIMLPDKNGLALLEELRKDPKYAKTPVLIMTVLPDEVAFEKAKNLDVIGTLQKDQTTPEQLAQRVKLALDEVTPPPQT